MKMRKTKSAYSSFFLLLVVALLSFSSNPPNGRTGAPGEGTCSGCHSSPPAGIQGLVSIENLPSTVMPNTTYSLTVRTEATMGSPSTGGFQLVVLDDSNSNMGDLITSTSDVGTNTAGTGREYVEHRGDKAFSGNEVEWSFDWLSPATGNGNVNIWASSVLANNNGNNGGDRVALTVAGVPFSGGANPPIVSVSTVDVDCFGNASGSATANVTDGTPPYTYLWSNNQTTATISNLISGIYPVTVTDATNVTATASGVINQPNPITIAFSTTPPLCPGNCDGTVLAVPNGGVGNYSYQWSPIPSTNMQLNNICAGTYTVTVTDDNGCSAVESVILNDPPPLSVTTNSTDVLCFGECTGTATVFLNGVIPPQCIWSDGQPTTTATNLCFGTYGVTVTDANGCTAIGSVFVSEPNEINATSNSTDASCNGDCDGTATVTAAGGTGIFTYLWGINAGGQTTATATGLCAGIYDVTVTDINGCTVEMVNIIVNEPSGITLTTSSTDVSCNGDCDGTATVTVTGGTGTFTYFWDASASSQTTATAFNLCPGIYSVTVTDANNCTETITATVNETSAISITGQVTPVACNGECNGEIIMTVSGGSSGYNFQWSDNGPPVINRTNLCSDPYTVTVTDANGCTEVETFLVTEPSAISFFIDVSPASCAGDCAMLNVTNLTGGTPGYTFDWSNGDNAQGTQACSSGIFSVTVTDSNGCEQLGIVNINIPGPISISSSFEDPTCFGLCDGSIDVTVTGGSGVLSFNWNDGTSTEDRTNLCDGLYHLTVTDENGCTITDTISLNDPPAITISTTSNDVTCNGDCNGSATATASGGTGVLVYLWDAATGNQVTQTAVFLCPGVYSVTATDNNGCTATSSVSVNEPSLIMVNATATNETSAGANDGTASAAPTGGVGNYTYLWSNTETTQTIVGLSPNSYTVTVTDNNGCTQVETVVVNSVNCQVMVNITSTDVACNGQSNGSALATASNGTPPYIYNWSNSTNNPMLTGVPAGNYTVTVTDALNCSITGSIGITEPTLLQLSGVVTDVSCFGECNAVIDVTVTGGTTPYSYQWNTGTSPNTEDQVGICPGTYVVIVTDNNGCTESATFIVSEPTPLIVSLAAMCESAPGANDGSILSNVSGGVGNYTYLWNTGATSSQITNLAPGGYTLTVTDQNGCFQVASDTVCSATCNLALTITELSVSCNGGNDGTAVATVGNGTPPYSYQWSSGGTSNPETGLSAGTYFLIVTDNLGCTAMADFQIMEPTPLTATINPISGVSCNGDTDGIASIIPSGGIGPYTFNWSNGGTNSTQNNLPANGTVQVIDANSCSQIFPYSLPEPTLLTVDMSSTPETTLGAMDGTASANPIGGTPPYQYLWSNNETNATISNLSPGSYSVIVTDANNCTATNMVEVNAGGCDLVLESLTTINILCNGDIGSATIVVSGGTTPYTYLWSSGGSTDTESGLAAGNYTVTVLDANDCVVSSQFTISEAPILELAILNQSSVQCGGDATASATVQASGGTPPYNYSWSSGGTSATETNLTNLTYTVTVIDQNQCETEVTITIEAEDTTPPVISPTPPDITLYLDQQGSSVINTASINAGVSDNCGTVNTSINLDTFNCSMVGLPQTVTYTASDLSGNMDMTTFLVTVLDTLAPEITTQDIVVNLGSNGTATIVAADLIASSNDNCGIDSIEIDRMEFSCVDVGVNTIYVVVFDINGNCTTDSALVTVSDNIAPVIICPGDIVSTDCDGIVTYVIDFTDNCPMSNLVLVSGFPSGSEFPPGITEVRYEVTDASGNKDSCSFIVDVQNVSPPLGAVAAIIKEPCFGQMDGILEAIPEEGIPPYTFLWNDPQQQTTAVASNLAAGNYTVMILDSLGCDTASVTIELMEGTAVDFNVVSLTNANNGGSDGSIDMEVTGGTSPYGFLWNNGATTEDLNDVPAGFYVLEVTDANGCTFNSDTLIIDDLTGLRNFALEQSIELFPNPNDGQFTIYFKGMALSEEWQIDLIDLQGRLVDHWQKRAQQESRLIDKTNLVEGVYLLRLSNEKEVVLKKVVINYP